jgi:hypothetical protein
MLFSVSFHCKTSISSITPGDTGEDPWSCGEHPSRQGCPYGTALILEGRAGPKSSDSRADYPGTHDAERWRVAGKLRRLKGS